MLTEKDHQQNQTEGTSSRMKSRVSSKVDERQTLIRDKQFAIFRQQQSAVAKVLKRTIVKLKETQAALDVATAELMMVKHNEGFLSSRLVVAQQQAGALWDFFHSVCKEIYSLPMMIQPNHASNGDAEFKHHHVVKMQDNDMNADIILLRLKQILDAFQNQAKGIFEGLEGQ